MKLQIEKVVYGGDGLARTDDGRAILVPYVLPGELVRVEPVASDDGRISLRVEEVEEPSAQRVEQRCRHFGRCGG